LDNSTHFRFLKSNLEIADPSNQREQNHRNICEWVYLCILWYWR